MDSVQTRFIRATDEPDQEHFGRRLSRRAATGELTRIRRGIYVPSTYWSELPPWERYRLHVEAVAVGARSDPLFSHQSAAILWGLPLIVMPTTVHTLVGTCSGGRSRRDIRRHSAPLGSIPTTRLGEHLVTDKVSTARDLAVTLPFSHAVAVMDRLLGGKPLPAEAGLRPVTKEDVAAAIALLPNGTQIRRATAVLDCADGQSGSAGESVSRAWMYRLGFPAPVLQHPVIDRNGHRIGLTDFFWKDYGLVGEFDGLKKYSRGEYTQGLPPEEVLAAEKEREDRIRATGLRVTRWLWNTAVKPELLREHLVQAGLPLVRK